MSNGVSRNPGISGKLFRRETGGKIALSARPSDSTAVQQAEAALRQAKQDRNPSEIMLAQESLAAAKAVERVGVINGW